MSHLLLEQEQLEMPMDLNLDESDPGLGGVDFQLEGTFLITTETIRCLSNWMCTCRLYVMLQERVHICH